MGDFGFLGFLGFWALGAMSGIGIPENPMESGAGPRVGEQSSSSLVGKLYGSPPAIREKWPRWARPG